MKDHKHVELPGGATATVDPDCPPETLEALSKMVECARKEAMENFGPLPSGGVQARMWAGEYAMERHERQRSCDCRLCKRDRRFRRIIGILPREDREWMDQFYCSVRDAEVEAEMLKAKEVYLVTRDDCGYPTCAHADQCAASVKPTLPPKRIWLQVWGDAEPDDTPFEELVEVTWCEDKIYDHDFCYLRADVPEHPSDGRYTVDEIAEYLAGWSTPEEYKGAFLNVINQLRDEQDGFEACKIRGGLTKE